MINIVEASINVFTINELQPKASFDPSYYFFAFTDFYGRDINLSLVDDSSYPTRYSQFTIHDTVDASFRASGEYNVYASPTDTSIYDPSTMEFLENGMYTYIPVYDEDFVYEPSVYSDQGVDTVFSPLFPTHTPEWTMIFHDDTSARNLVGNHPLIDASLTRLDASIVRLDTWNEAQDASISALQIWNAAQDVSIIIHDVSIVALQVWNTAQDVSILIHDSSIVALQIWNTAQDASIDNLRNDYEASIGRIDASIERLDASIVRLDTWNEAQDASIDNLRNDYEASIGRIDASIIVLETWNEAQDASIDNLRTDYEASIGRIDASIVNLQSDLEDVSTNKLSFIDETSTGTYSIINDPGVGEHIATLKMIDSSSGIDIVQDGSTIWIGAAAGGDVTKAYVDGSLATRDASIENLRDEFEASTGRLDASIVALETWNEAQDASLDSLDTSVGIHDSSIGSLTSWNEAQDASLDLKFPLDGSFGQLVDVSISDAGLDQDGSSLIYDSSGFWKVGPGGAPAFSGLKDTPDSYTGEAGQVVIVEDNETSIGFSTDKFYGQTYIDGSLNNKLNLDTSLSDLSDVSLIYPIPDRQSLAWDAADEVWINADSSSLIIPLENLSDTSIAGKATWDAILFSDASYWENYPTVDISSLIYTKDEIDASIERIDASIERLDASIERLDASIVALETWNEAQDASLDSLDTSVGIHDTSIGALQDWNTAQDASLDSLDTSIGIHETSIGALETSVDSLDTSVGIHDSSIGDLQDWNTAQDASIDNINTDISNLDSSLDLYLPLSGGTMTGDINTEDTGSENTRLGVNSMSSILAGAQNNTGIGYNALTSLTEGDHNTAVGRRTLDANTTGGSNTALGSFSLTSSITASFNTAVGNSAMTALVEGDYNVAIGNLAMQDASDCDANVAIGAAALNEHQIGNENTAVGYAAFVSLTSGDQNTALGNRAGRYYGAGSDALTTANYSIFIGDRSRAKEDDSSNEIVIGYSAIGEGDNTVKIGNDSITDWYLGSTNIFDYIDTSLGTRDTEISSIDTSIGIHETSIGALETSVSSLDTSIGIVDTSIGILDSSKADLDIAIVDVSQNYTVQASDAGKLIAVDGSVMITLPDDIRTGIQIIFVNDGTSNVDFDASTLHSKDSSTLLSSQYAGATAIHRGSGTWNLMGDLTG